MTTLKYALILGLAALGAPSAKAALVDFHFGATTQTGPAAIGTAGDFWNANDKTNGGPVLLKDVTGQPTSISASWTSGDAWAPAKPIYFNAGPAMMDPATVGLMTAFAASYAYGTGTATNLSFSLSGLAHNQAYTLVLYGAGNQHNEGSQFTVYGNGTFTGSTSGLTRRISLGAGVAYVSIPVVSSSTGTLKITVAKGNYNYSILNGLQLALGTATAPKAIASTPATAAVAKPAPIMTPAPVKTPVSTPVTTMIPAPTATTPPTTTTPALPPLIWGVNGHPTESDYASWIPANFTTQMTDLNQVGATYYRVSFEGASYPQILSSYVPSATAAKVTLLPILPINLVAADSAQANYDNNYTLGYTWAAYAISKGYAIPTWELGNEVENWDLVNVVYDGTTAGDFPDKTPGGFVAIANGFNGAYQGIKDAYAAGRAANTTTITPQVLIGMCYRHWGLLAKIQAYDNGVLPCDAISWHWYGPNYGGFNSVINDPRSAGNGRTPAACLGDFKSKSDPTKPMDIWLTETNRSQSVNGVLLNGSVASDTAPSSSQDWTAEATAIQSNVDSFKPVASVKAIFVYELFDETIATSSSTGYLASEGYFGLITGLQGTKKNAFYAYQNEIKAGR